MATHSSILAWRILGTGAWWAAVYGVTQSRTRLTWLSGSISARIWVFDCLNYPSSTPPCPSSKAMQSVVVQCRRPWTNQGGGFFSTSRGFTWSSELLPALRPGQPPPMKEVNSGCNGAAVCGEVCMHAGPPWLSMLTLIKMTLLLQRKCTFFVYSSLHARDERTKETKGMLLGTRWAPDGFTLRVYFQKLGGGLQATRQAMDILQPW